MPQSISQRATRRKGTWVLVFVFSMFSIVGGVAFFAMFVNPLLKILAAKDWNETPCRVISSEVGSHRGSDSTTYSIDIVYAYRVDSREFQSNRYDFTDLSSSGYEGKAEIVEGYPPGQSATCYVNPSDPAEAVLERGFVTDMYFGLIPLVFLLVGVVGVTFTARAARRQRARVQQKEYFSDQGAAPRPMPPGDVTLESFSEGPVILESNVAPKGKLIGITVFSVFWNGIVSVFVWFAYDGWRKGEPEWFLIVFLIPFVLVGIGSLIGIGYFFLGLFNPRAKLTVNSDVIPLGGTLDLEWQMTGRAHLIQRLHIYLEGQEEATYRRGTDTHTDRETFATIDIADTPTPSSILWNETRMTIPQNTMHTFSASHNKITWTLHVRGALAHWPDIDEEFEITVAPVATSPRW